MPPPRLPRMPGSTPRSVHHSDSTTGVLHSVVARAVLVLLGCVACGDNLPAARDAAGKDAPSTARCVPVRGGTVEMKRVVEGCPLGTPPVSCMNGVVTLVT